MKRTLAYISALLLLLGIVPALPALAQQKEDLPVQDAMYVYRNDGKFHGFFNADVVRMEFSKIDTLGREHIDYVVQEIETLDSLYRIPINAIDSVSFYTPPTEYVADVKVTTSSSMWDYVVASDSMTCITLSPSTPSGLLPNVGDKLCTTKSRKLLPGGFYGTVRKVSSTAAGTRLECDNDGLTAYLKRHIFKGGVQVNEDEQTPARRRRGARRAPDSPSVAYAELDTITFEKKLEGELELNDNFKLSGEVSTKVAFAPTIYASAFGAIGMVTGMNMDCALHTKVTTILDESITGKLEWSNDVPLSKRYIWITDTPFFIEIQPGIHFGMSGELELAHHEEVKISAMASAQINASLFTEQVLLNSNAQLLDRKSESKLTGTFTGNLGPYFAVNLILGTEEIGVMGLRAEAGAKLVVKAEMDLGNQEPVDEVSTKAYDRLNLNGSMKIGPYGQVGYNWKFLEKINGEKNIWEYEPGWEFEGGLVPKFGTINMYMQDEKSGQIMFSTNVDGNVLFFIGGPVGFALYDEKGKEIARQWDTRTYFDPRLWNQYSLTFSGVEYGKWYSVHPLCHLLNYELVASPGTKFYAGVQDLLVDPEGTVTIDHMGGTQFISVKNTFSDKTNVGTSWIQDKWLTFEEAPGGYNVTIQPNETTKRREATLYFSAQDPNNMFNSRRREVLFRQEFDPKYLGLLMQTKELNCQTDEETSDLWVWTASDSEFAENGRWGLWGFRPIIGCDDVEEAFDKNPIIKKNDDGTFTLEGDGLTIQGKFDPVAPGEPFRTGSGTFTLSTDMQHHRKSKEDVERMLRTGVGFCETDDFTEFFNPALDEHYKRVAEGTVSITWDSNKEQYVFAFNGNGTVTYDAECYWELCGLNSDYVGDTESLYYTPQPFATLGETKTVSINCNTTIDCTVRYELNE